MARVTIEDCIAHVNNRFFLVQAAIRRTRQLIEGSKPLVSAKNREAVVALREIAAEKVKPHLQVSKRTLPPQSGDELGEAALLEAEIEETGIEAPPAGSEEPESEPAASGGSVGEEEAAEGSDLQEKEQGK
jgi:DNA-directed RNA polymerase subunit omega